jgi:hypothetical protein
MGDYMEKVSFKKVIKNDSYTISLLLVSVLFAIMLVIYLVMPDEVSSLGLYVIIGIDAVSIIMLFIRFIILLSFKSEDKVYKATVIKTFVYRSSRHIKFVYTIDGVDYTKKNVLLSSKFSREINKDDEIEIYVSQSNTAKALIIEAYFETEVL